MTGLDRNDAALFGARALRHAIRRAKSFPAVLVLLLFPIAVRAPAEAAAPETAFANFESPHVHPLDVTPDGKLLLAVNTADGRLEIFAIGNGPQGSGTALAPVAAVPVGVDPVSVRARGNDEAWVVNHVSDSVCIVDLQRRAVVATLRTRDEPADVVFAGTPERAFVSCSQMNELLVFDPANLAAAPAVLPIEGEDPRALATDASRSRVFVAVFESGNGTTLLAGGGGEGTNSKFPPNAVSDPTGPYGGVNPPPNAGNVFSPALDLTLPRAPEAGLIVRRMPDGSWFDDNYGEWTDFIRGAKAPLSGRVPGWDLADHDVAVVDATTLSVTYQPGLMNACMALAADPVSGDVLVVGTDATNEIRFERNVRGTFVRVLAAHLSSSGSLLGVTDLNPHLDYGQPTAPQIERDRSIGDPRAVVFDAAGDRAYVAGMGSNNVVAVDRTGARVNPGTPIEVGEGPTGLALHPSLARMYVLNRFDASLSVIDLATRAEVVRRAFHDATPHAIRAGRAFLYDTHETSGLGQASCGSCHIDARTDRLAWALGDPSGATDSPAGQNVGGTLTLAPKFEDWHPMKGPMFTQTLQDVVGKEPFHWRGDRDGLEAFNGAYESLLGDDEQLTPAEMQAFEDFLATVRFPPNPYRLPDNSLPANVPLPGHVSAGRFSPKGTPMPSGNAQHGLDVFRTPGTITTPNLSCASCHTLPTGLGTELFITGFKLTPFPTGPNGEHHHAIVSLEMAKVPVKVPQLRGLYDKIGFDLADPQSRAGFGFLQDGAMDTLVQFLSEPQFGMADDQMISDVVAFLLAFGGSDLPEGSLFDPFEPLGPDSLDAHAAVGRQVTVQDGANPSGAEIAELVLMLGLADQGAVGWVAKGIQGTAHRGYVYAGAGAFQSDRVAERRTVAGLVAGAAPGNELTFTLVVKGTETRIGVDRDADGVFDRDELDAGSDPADASATPDCGAMTAYGAGCAGSGGEVPSLSGEGCLTAGGFGRIEVAQVAPNAPMLFAIGATAGSTPIGKQCTLLVAPLAPLFGPFPANASGVLEMKGSLPAGQLPLTMTLQALVADPGIPLGFVTSNGLAIDVK